MISCNRYRSIRNVFKRDHDTHKVLPGEFSVSEFRYLQDCKWIFTEKMDGMNIRIILDDGGFEFRGRSDRAQLPGPLSQHLRGLIDDKCVDENFCLYGEGMGAGIQAGAKYGPTQSFILFDIMTDCGWATRRDMVDIANKLQIPVVPIVLEGTLTEAVRLVSAGLESTYGNFFAEGLVGRPEPGLLDRYGGRITCKIKHKDFY